MDVNARLWPFTRGNEAAVDITVYVVTGRHGLLTVPESFCRECHLFVQAAEQAAEEVEADVEVHVRSWWTGFPVTLLHGGYHPPVMLVDGELMAQGHDVPSPDDIVAAIT